MKLIHKITSVQACLLVWTHHPLKLIWWDTEEVASAVNYYSEEIGLPTKFLEFSKFLYQTEKEILHMPTIHILWGLISNHA
jgi:hypothetical protein